MIPDNIQIIVPEKGSEEELISLASDVEVIICVHLSADVARAAIIQEEPLFRALKDGWIAGAALDVWWSPHWWSPTWKPSGETPKYEFWKLPNVIATPHCIGQTDTPSDAGLHIIAENIRRVAHGRQPINLVDKQLQY